MHLATTPASLSAEDWCFLGQRTESFSGSDLSNCTSDAMFEPVRELEGNTQWKLNQGTTEDLTSRTIAVIRLPIPSAFGAIDSGLLFFILWMFMFKKRLGASS